MADDTSEDNIGPLLADLAKYGIGTAGTLGANQTMQAAYEAILKNLRDRFGDYAKLTPAQFKEIVAQKLGPSALSNIQNDAGAREAEQAQLAQLDDIAKSGGLTLADKAALNEAEATLSRGNSARNNSIANQFASRGQLGAGEQLAMQLAGAQSAGEQANKRGEEIAAQAQKRAMQAVLEKGSAARAMSNEDYRRKANAASAADSIEKYNASMATDAGKYNNDLKDRAFKEELERLAGQTGLTQSMNQALLGQGQQSANTQAGLAYGGTRLVTDLARAAKNFGNNSDTGAKDAGGGSDNRTDGGATGENSVQPDAGNSDTGATDAGGGSDGGTDGGAVGEDSVSPGAGEGNWETMFDDGDGE